MKMRHNSKPVMNTKVIYGFKMALEGYSWILVTEGRRSVGQNLGKAHPQNFHGHPCTAPPIPTPTQK